jgi:hypothetical protein
MIQAEWSSVGYPEAIHMSESRQTADMESRQSGEIATDIALTPPFPNALARGGLEPELSTSQIA